MARNGLFVSDANCAIAASTDRVLRATSPDSTFDMAETVNFAFPAHTASCLMAIANHKPVLGQGDQIVGLGDNPCC